MAASSQIPMQIAETVQTAHINPAPSAARDVNPSTAADTRVPVQLEEKPAAASASADGDVDEDEIPVSVLRAPQRSSHLPPIPDLRFEQSYLHSIRDAKSWWAVAWITARDQLMMPMLQGVVYNLAWCGWQHWNKNAQLSGNSWGAKARRWWYGVNKWRIDGRSNNWQQKDWYQRR